MFDSRRAPQWFILIFLILMLLMSVRADIPVAGLLSDSLVRLFMNGVLVLSLLPMLRAGVGVNYGLPVGILPGLLALCITINYDLQGAVGFLIALLLAALLGVAFGYPYALILNRVKGREEIAGLFIGFSSVYAICFFWAVAPFSNPIMLWPIGGYGLRPNIGLSEHFSRILNVWGAWHLGGLTIPLGGLASFLILCLLLSMFFRTRIGLAITATGENPLFAHLSGIDINHTRAVAVMLSTALAAVGICFYAQSYGFVELYEAPLMMAIPAASAILLGGRSGFATAVSQAVIGTFLFQSVYVISGPLANSLLVPELSEIIRVIISSGVILYALIFTREGGGTNEKA